jgi:hypothetical protein
MATLPATFPMNFGPVAAETLGAYLGQTPDVARFNSVLSVVAAQVRAYVRDNGFNDDGTVAQDIASVILSVAARLVSNPSQLKSESMGPFQIQYPTTGFTVSELAVLNRHRIRAL